MVTRRVLDLFCGQGGAAMGWQRAGFEVVGVDNRPRRRYPFEFYRADAIEFLQENGGAGFDLIHASPPCQPHSRMAHLSNGKHHDLIDDVRQLLRATGLPYVIENVPGAPLINPLMLCGTMFGLRVIRHRLFECNPIIWFPPRACCHDTGGILPAGRGPSPKGFWSVAGKGGGNGTTEGWGKAMGIDWMTLNGLSQAIPPAYLEYIGRQMMDLLEWS